jgi:regulator of protease activity HflC (stomatin/prohibitin superfamily)
MRIMARHDGPGFAGLQPHRRTFMSNRLQRLLNTTFERISPRWPQRRAVALVGLAAGLGGLLWLGAAHPPLRVVASDELALRTNRLDGQVTAWRGGVVWVLPGIHDLHRYSTRDQTWRAVSMAHANSAEPAQTLEGLSIGLELSLRYAIDAQMLAARSSPALPEDLARDVIEPAVQGVVYKVIARHTVREIFSTQRADIEQAIAEELRGKLAAQGLLLRAVQIGNVDLPPDYRKGLDGLLAEGLESEKMRYTLALKDQQVKQTALEAQADKVRRETAAEAAARETVIAAKGQEEAMEHVLPFKQRQIEQRKLEAEGERQARVRMAEGAAEARQIEAQGEAAAREKLADAEAYRIGKLGKANAEQMAVEGALITQHPLLIQKAMADRLSDKIQVIIAPPPQAGGFVGNALLGAPGLAAARSAPGRMQDTQVGNDAEGQ